MCFSTLLIHISNAQYQSGESKYTGWVQKRPEDVFIKSKSTCFSPYFYTCFLVFDVQRLKWVIFLTAEGKKLPPPPITLLHLYEKHQGDEDWWLKIVRAGTPGNAVKYKTEESLHQRLAPETLWCQCKCHWSSADSGSNLKSKCKTSQAIYHHSSTFCLFCSLFHFPYFKRFDQ